MEVSTEKITFKSAALYAEHDMRKYIDKGRRKGMPKYLYCVFTKESRRLNRLLGIHKVNYIDNKNRTG